MWLCIINTLITTIIHENINFTLSIFSQCRWFICPIYIYCATLMKSWGVSVSLSRTHTNTLSVSSPATQQFIIQVQSNMINAQSYYHSKVKINLFNILGNKIPHRSYCLNVSDLAKASTMCACLPARPSFAGFELSCLALLWSEHGAVVLVGGFLTCMGG